MPSKCPSCGIKVYIERGRCIRTKEMEDDLKKGLAKVITQGCITSDWKPIKKCPNCGVTVAKWLLH